MDRIGRLKKKETKLVNKGYKAVDEGRERKADRLLGRAAKTENRIIKLSEKKPLTKAQKGITVKPTTDSTAYHKKEIAGYDKLIKSEPKTKIGKSNTNVYLDFRSKAYDNLNRQYLKGKPGYDKNGFPIKKAATKKKG